MAADEWETLLRAHACAGMASTPEGWSIRCACGHTDRDRAEHNAHLAALIEARVQQREAAAWDWGYSDGLDYMSLPYKVRQVEPENPYREGATAEQRSLGRSWRDVKRDAIAAGLTTQQRIDDARERADRIEGT